jgi:hypothetical protein
MSQDENANYLMPYNAVANAIEVRKNDTARDLRELREQAAAAGRDDLAAALDTVIAHNERLAQMMWTLRHGLVTPTPEMRAEIERWARETFEAKYPGQTPGDEGGVWPFQTGNA